MQERRATDTLWMELRRALLAEARECSLGSRSIDINEVRTSGLRLQAGQRRLDVHATREQVTCTISIGPEPDSCWQVPVDMHPGSVPSFRLHGRPAPAQHIPAKLMAALFDHER